MTSSDSPALNVLFLCTGNSARSILAEGMMNHPSIGGRRFHAFSAGSHLKGVIDPFAIDILRQQGISTEGLRSKSWEEFAGPEAPSLHFVFTVCDQASAELCPIWPGQPMTAHWGVADPAAVTASDAARLRVLREAALILRRRIDLFVSLPIDSLTRLALQERLDAIGHG